MYMFYKWNKGRHLLFMYSLVCRFNWLFFNEIQSKRGNQQDVLFLAGARKSCYVFWMHENCGGAISGPFGWIFEIRYKKQQESCTVWQWSKANFCGEIALTLEPFKNINSNLVLLLRGKVNRAKSFKITQNNSSEAKGQKYATRKVW